MQLWRHKGNERAPSVSKPGEYPLKSIRMEVFGATCLGKEGLLGNGLGGFTDELSAAVVSF